MQRRRCADINYHFIDEDNALTERAIERMENRQTNLWICNGCSFSCKYRNKMIKYRWWPVDWCGADACPALREPSMGAIVHCTSSSCSSVLCQFLFNARKTTIHLHHYIIMETSSFIRRSRSLRCILAHITQLLPGKMLWSYKFCAHSHTLTHMLIYFHCEPLLWLHSNIAISYN